LDEIESSDFGMFIAILAPEDKVEL